VLAGDESSLQARDVGEIWRETDSLLEETVSSELAQAGPLNAVEREETSLPAFKSRTNHQATEG
jgi:hypothetical protein